MSADELERAARARFRLLPDIQSLMADFARSIADEIEAGATRFILPVGPVAQYPLLVDICRREAISWRNVHVFLMDEFLDWQGRPIGAGHPLSFEGYFRRNVLPHVDLPESQFTVPHPFRIEEASERIAAAGGIDVCYGGIGYHGHVAFNEPPLSRWRTVSVAELRESRTRVLTLGDDSIVVQSIHSAGGNCEAIPPMAVTLGMKDILASRKIRLYCAAGPRHQAVFRRTVAGEVTVAYPATLVQGHPDAEICTDIATAEPIAVGLR